MSSDFHSILFLGGTLGRVDGVDGCSESFSYHRIGDSGSFISVLLPSLYVSKASTELRLVFSNSNPCLLVRILIPHYSVAGVARTIEDTKKRSALPSDKPGVKSH